MHLLPKDMNGFQTQLHQVHCEKQLGRLRGMMERWQQLRKFPESRNILELRQQMHRATPSHPKLVKWPVFTRMN
ncbi:MAG: hypothetical protein K2Q01_03715 [Rickettsiales bacterium]|nr:hypothetical protein [Rickettsiales bacterium]